jgi:hypothetical protein
MIPLEERHYDAIYKPNWPPSKRAWNWVIWIWFRIKIGIYEVGLRHALVRILRRP